MKPSIVVLTDFSPAAAQARAYAAVLAAPLGASIHLVQVFFPPVMNPEVSMVMLAVNARDTEETRLALNKLATEMPVPATAELLENGWDGAVADVLARYRPLLLVTGLTATSGFFDELFSNRTLSLAHDTGYPLLLVPQNLPAAARHPPHRPERRRGGRPAPAVRPERRGCGPARALVAGAGTAIQGADCVCVGGGGAGLISV